MPADATDREQRRQEMIALVLELGSYVAAARQLGISKQRVHAIVGGNLVDSRSVAATCVDCGEPMRTNMPERPRCHRCQSYFTRYGVPRTAERLARPHKREPRSHCKRGHAMTGENVYTYPDGKRSCRACKALQYERSKRDPERRAHRLAYYREYYRTVRRPKYQAAKLAKDTPERL